MIGCITQLGIDASNANALKAQGGDAASHLRRPYISEGHAAASPGAAQTPRQVRLPWQAGVGGDGPGADRVRYHQAGPFPVNVDGVQVSLSEVRPHLPSTDGGAAALPGIPQAGGQR